MIKNILGSWGAHLADDDYACALAALGVLESVAIPPGGPTSYPSVLARRLEGEFMDGERTPVWRQRKDVNAGTTIASWHETSYEDPAALAEAWRQFVSRTRHERMLPRLAIPASWREHHDIVNVDDLCLWLQRAHGLYALVMAEPDGPERVPWHWPLRVGVPEGAEGAVVLQMLHAAQRPQSWVERLARCYTVGSARDTCDLLILPPSPALDAANRLSRRLRASFVACLEIAAPPSFPPEVHHHDLLLGRLGAAGVASVGPLHLHPGALGDWFAEVLRQVSHDVPIHAAVWSVGRHFFREAVVIGYPSALDTCRILALAERHDRIVDSLRPLDVGETPTTAVDGEPTFGGIGAAYPDTSFEFGLRGPSGLQARFADELRSRMFTSEVEDGDSTAREFETRGRDILDGRARRWIQGDAWRPAMPGAVASSLEPAQWNLIGVHIGPSAVRRAGAAFPDAKLDFTRGDVAVNVQLELAGATVTTLPASGGVAADALPTLAPLAAPAAGSDPDLTGIDSAAMALPPAGASPNAWFAVYPHVRSGYIDGRISIIHANRVLQTARLRVEVDVDPNRGNGVDVRAEATIHAPDEDLAERRAYDVAIQVSDVGGRLHMTIDQDGQPVTVRLDDLSNPIARISVALEEIAKKRDFSKSLFDQPVFTQTLYTLAAAGAEIEQHLRKKCGNEIDGWERIHLMPSTNQFLPLEYVYDGLPPKFGAAVCPNMGGALENGSCDRAVGGGGAASACPNQRAKAFLCPMHFWGFRRLIERNGAVDTDVPPATTPQPISVPGRQPYGTVNGLAYAASNRAFLYAPDDATEDLERKGVIAALEALCKDVMNAPDWDEWRDDVKKQPNLLVLIAHTDEVASTPMLEIGNRKLLARHEILADVSGANGKPQLLILLGCSAANVAENFQPYPERFRDAGVSIVLAPVAPIRGADAVPITKRLAQLLADSIKRTEPVAFGELLPVLRRQLLREGHAGVMGIVGFGDGDWLIGG